MPKAPAKHRFTPHHEWIRKLRAAYKELPQKAEALEACGVSTSTAGRITNGKKDELDKVGYDSLEALRLEINKRLKKDLPPPAHAMRSPEHHAWSRLGLDLDEQEKLAAIEEWSRLGAKLRDLRPDLFAKLRDDLLEIVDAAERGKQSDDDMERSRDGFVRTSASLRNVGSAPSDRPGKTGHGPRSNR